MIAAMTLYSLHHEPAYGQCGDNEQLFHDYRVLRQVAIVSTADRQRIVEAVRRGIADSDGKMARCFFPRHGVGMIEDGKTVEYLICFECWWTKEFVDGQVSNKPTTIAPQAVLDPFLET
jgi:hypothetical protein